MLRKWMLTNQILTITNRNFKSRFSVLIYGAYFILIFFNFKLYGFDGSFGISGSQCFFSNSELKYVNNDSAWGAVRLDADFGLTKVFGIEPMIQVGLIKNSSATFEYQVYSFSPGVRYRAWNHETFLVSPVIQAQLETHYARGRPMNAGGLGKTILGFDAAFALSGGAFISFMFDKSRKDDLRSEWDVNDFGMLLFLKYVSPSFMNDGNFFRRIDEISHWGFGLGLMVDWA